MDAAAANTIPELLRRCQGGRSSSKFPEGRRLLPTVAALAVAVRRLPLEALSARALSMVHSGTAWRLRCRIAGLALAVTAEQLRDDRRLVAALTLAAGRRVASSRTHALAARSWRPNLCFDTFSSVIGQLWPPSTDKICEAPIFFDRSCGDAARIQGGARLPLSPRTFEIRLRSLRSVLQELRHVAAVSAAWARFSERRGWPAAHFYLFQKSGSKGELRQRYVASMRRLLVEDRIRSTQSSSSCAIRRDGTASLANRIVSFVT